MTKALSVGGGKAAWRFAEFFIANIRSRNTRAADARAVAAFCRWREERGQDFLALKPVSVAASVRGPEQVVKRGKTPVLKPAEARELLDSIDTSAAAGVRDRALIAVMIYSFARVSAVVGMDVDDYHKQGKRWWIRLAEKGGKAHALPVHHKAEEYLDALGNPAKGPLFRAITKERGFDKNRLSRIDAFRMVKRRSAAAGLGAAPNCHTFRATGITAYLLNGGRLEGAKAIAAHESARTTKVYDRTSDEITLDEIERIGI